MNVSDYLRELAFPFRSLASIFALLAFSALFALSFLAVFLGFVMLAVAGIWLLIVTLAAYFRFLTLTADARAHGREAEPPGIEFFSLVGNLWTLFPAALVLLLGIAVTWAYLHFNSGIAILVAAVSGLLWPATVGVLVITQSPMQSVNPFAVARFIRGCGSAYLYTPLTVLLIFGVAGVAGPAWPKLTIAMIVFLTASLFAVTGAVMRGAELVDDVDIPAAIEPDVEKVTADLLRERTGVLNHAYGFASRGNRDGGLAHIADWLRRDPDPDAAWPWFLEQMLRWEDSMPALLLAQRYVGRLLEAGETVRAVKLLMRCRMVDDAFRPLPEDLPRAVEAARACRNEDLAAALSR